MLAEAIDARNVIHVRGTPASGKTTLSKLLQKHFLEKNRKVYHLPGWAIIENEVRDGWTPLFNRLRILNPTFSWSTVPEDTVILIDEAQGSYYDLHFWMLAVKQRLNNDGPKVKLCFFASYGSPVTGVDFGTDRYTPIEFTTKHRIELTREPGEDSLPIGLFYTYGEFVRVVSIQTSDYNNTTFTLDGSALRCLYDLTNGHPGVVHALVDMLHKYYFRAIARGEISSTITVSQTRAVLGNVSAVFDYLKWDGVYRSFPKTDDRTPEADNLLREIRIGGFKNFDETAEMKLCYTRGWVHRTRMEEKTPQSRKKSVDIVVLPSMLHAIWVDHHLGENPQPFPAEYGQISEFCWKVLRNFSKVSLKHARDGKNISIASKARPLEAQYQDEFYRQFFTVVGTGVRLSSEWSRSGKGRVDFYIPDKCWAIEFLRDSDRLAEHIARFYPLGAYHKWIVDNSVADWIVINCTSSPPVAHGESRLFTAVFTNDYSQLAWYNNRGQMMFPPVSLDN
ncbi:hypothetical protein BP00DRAFT_444152 [Aspergillus indologenus CBS 114.80]|uniref:Uncharacterized protein n=1 Tax=Aspergillus indologenus CBS 114.80 TaxID=1450541 RepID=A0A2V5IBB1_9EURO|nr:hypothetical protein BP00DRAFT_444152 [Aspergillus indologenus CBS 114.80]